MKPRRRILVVDHDNSEEELVSSIVASLSADLVWCASGAEGRRLATEQDFDAIVLDILMPDGSGYDLCGALKADPRKSDIPVLFVTARHRAEDVLEGFASLAFDFLVRPFRPRELHARLRNALRTRALLEELKARVRFYERCLKISRSLSQTEDIGSIAPRITELMADIAEAYAADGVSISAQGRALYSWGDLAAPAAIEIPGTGDSLFRLHRERPYDADETSWLVELSELLLAGIQRYHAPAGSDRLVTA